MTFSKDDLMKISRRKSKLKSKLNRQHYIQIPLLNTNKVSDIKWAECYLAQPPGNPRPIGRG